MNMSVGSKPSPQQNNRKLLLVALAVFVIPFLAALLLHKTGLYKAVGTTNRGTLITPPVAFDSLPLTDAQGEPIASEALAARWWMVYVIPPQCDAACRNTLYQMRQVHKALGPDQDRVATMLIATTALPQDYRALIAEEFSELTVAHTEPEALQQWFTDTENDGLKQQQTGLLYLVDTMGAVFMYYPTYADEQESILKGRDLLKDLQKVLKLSKIG